MKGTILFVDDDYYEMLALEERLQTEGYDVTTCIGPEDAEKRLREGMKPDLIISDLIMRARPEQSAEEAHEGGVRFCENVRHEFHLECPILILSVLTDQRVQQKILSYADEFLHKPVAARTLLNHVHAALEGHRSRSSMDRPAGPRPDRRPSP